MSFERIYRKNKEKQPASSQRLASYLQDCLSYPVIGNENIGKQTVAQCRQRCSKDLAHLLEIKQAADIPEVESLHQAETTLSSRLHQKAPATPPEKQIEADLPASSADYPNNFQSQLQWRPHKLF